MNTDLISSRIVSMDNTSTKTSEFYRNMRPILMTLKFMGAFPYHVTSEGKMAFRYLSTITAYTAILQTFVIFGTTLRELRALSADKSTFESKMYFYVGLVVYEPAKVLIPLTHWPEACKKIRYFNEWSSFEVEFNRVTGKPLDLNLQHKVILGLLAVAAYVTVQNVPFVIRMYSSGMWWIIPTFFFCSFFYLLIVVPWVAFCSALRRTGEFLKKELEEHLMSYGYGYGFKIAEYRALWLQLCMLTQNLGSAMGVTFGAHVLTYFAGQVFFTYYTLSRLSTGLEEFAVQFVIPLCISLFIYLMCNAAHNASDQIGEKFLERLEFLQANFPPKTSEADTEIERFLTTIERNKPVITFCGYASVNRGLQTSFMSALVTYMVVLLQFNMDYQKLPKSSCGNVTSC